MDDDIEDPVVQPQTNSENRRNVSSRPFTSGANNASSMSTRVQANPDRASGPSTVKTGVVQPKPQTLPKRSGPTSIIVSPRQKGNPILNHVKGIPWEYGDIPADYLLGMTTCALFLSLKYHKLHPEYIYNRIKGLAGKYNLRIILVMVDVQNHEDSLKELSKTSLINNVTLVLCWSAAEGGRYLELFKSYEHAAPTSIKQHQSTTYADRMISFITSPRSINKTDAVSLVSQFGTVRTAVNASHEEIAGIAGWGEKKVKQWCSAVTEPFRVQRAARRGALSTEVTIDSQPISQNGTPTRDVPADDALDYADTREDSEEQVTQQAKLHPAQGSIPSARTDGVGKIPNEATDDQEATTKRSNADVPGPAKRRRQEDDDLNDGILAALSKLREEGG